jgi:hypothetical protein
MPAHAAERVCPRRERPSRQRTCAESADACVDSGCEAVIVRGDGLWVPKTYATRRYS